MLNELFFLQTLVLITLFIYVKLINILALWYAAGLYLILLGLFLLCFDGDIFIGFLWVVDFGVGLIFFIFVLHFSNFLYQKSLINIYARSFISYFFYLLVLCIFYFFLSLNQATNYITSFKNNWFLYVTWYDFYNSFSNYTTTNLHLLREIYFYHNSFEFFLINFMLLYGIVTAVTLSFMLKKIFNILTVSQFKSLNLLKTTGAVYFIRQQNFLKQQNTSTGTRVWNKKKPTNPQRDF